MKFNSLINLVKRELKKEIIISDVLTRNRLKYCLVVLKNSRNKQHLVNIIKREKVSLIFKELLEIRLRELNDRITHEKMFFEDYSDIEENIKRYEREIEFYNDLKERICDYNV